MKEEINNKFSNILVNGNLIDNGVIETKKKILIKVDISPSRSRSYGGPITLNKSINEILPYNNNYCTFVPSEAITLNNTKDKADYFYLSLPRLSEKDFDEWIKTNNSNRLLLGPNFVPSNWFKFPVRNNWKERRFAEFLEAVKGMVVHSDRVKDHLIKNSNTTSLIHKYINLRACTNLKSIDKVKSFNERSIDILYYEKFSDLNRSKQGEELFKLLNSTNKNVVKMNYGSYDKRKMIEWGNDSKFIIYFSFYDTGAIGLKEIQNLGVFAFTLQADLVCDNSTTFYIPELEEEKGIKKAYEKIMKKIEIITKENPDTELVVKKNYDNNNCRMALNDLCEGIIFNNN